MTVARLPALNPAPSRQRSFVALNEAFEKNSSGDLIVDG
jgi:hypothetical protein